MKNLLPLSQLRYLLLKFIMLICFLSTGKVGFSQMNCLTAPEGASSATAPCDNPNNYFPDTTLYQATALKTIYINYHFILNDTCGINYTANDDGIFGNDTAILNGVELGHYFTSNLNNLYSNFEANAISNLANVYPPRIKDSRIRFETYTNPENPNDTYGGIWFHCNDVDTTDYDGWRDFKGDYTVYGDTVIDIFFIRRWVYNDTKMIYEKDGLSGEASKGSADSNASIVIIGLFDDHVQKYLDPGYSFDYWSYTNLIGHEIGHLLSLTHVFESHIDCVDYSHSKECNSGGGSDCHNWESGSNNMMGYNGYQNALTPCQIGGLRVFLDQHEPTYVVNFDCSNLDSTITISTGSHVWTSEKKINGDIIIDSTATLEIKCKIQMPFESEIIIKPGGKLKITDGEITACDPELMWNGIKVQGHPKLFQNLANQGTLETNNAKISYARTAISNSGNAYPFNSGGRINVNNTEFYNNKRSISMVSFKPEVEFFPTEIKGSEFVVDDNLPGDEDFISHITLWDVNRVYISNCDFYNRQTEPLEYDTLKSAIYTIDAGFSVDGSSSDSSRFEGFYRAINTENSFSGKSTIIKKSIFSNNIIGILLKGANNSTIQDCSFNVGSLLIPSNHEHGEDIHEGIMLHACANSMVRGNKFLDQHTYEKYGVTYNKTHSIGYRGLNLGSLPGNVDLNFYDSLSIANQSEGLNRNKDLFKIGLLFTCNDMKGDAFDIFVDTIKAGDGIPLYQGTSAKSASNKFSRKNVTYPSDLLNTGFLFNYYYYGLGTGASNRYYPANFTDPTIDGYQASELLPCGSIIGPGTEKFLSGNDSTKLVLSDSLRSWSIDTTKSTIDLIRLYRQDSSITAWYGIIDLQIQAGETAAAVLSLDTLTIRYGLNTNSASYDYSLFKNLKYWQIHHVNADSTFNQLNSTDKTFLKDISANSKQLPGAQASALLNAFGGTKYFEVAHYPPVADSLYGRQQSLLQSKVENLWVCYPNPSHDYFVFKRNSPSLINSKLTIFDAIGRTILETIIIGNTSQYRWNASQVGHGFYFYRIEGVNEQVNQGILIKQ